VAYFVVGLAVYVRSDLALVNPTLYLLGGQIVQVQHGGTARAGGVPSAPE
jgi:hypothetical protein